MKKETKKWIVTTSLAFTCVLSCAIGTQVLTASADTAKEADLQMLSGASIRMDVSNADGEVVVGSGTGIRFSATASKDLVATLVENGEYKSDAELGMLMVPAKYMSDYTAQLNEDNAYDDYFTYFSEVKEANETNIKYVYPAEKLSTTEANNINVTLESLLDDNYDLSYQALAYYKLGGTTYYSAPSETRKVAEVAHAALTDTEKTYTADQRTALGNIIEKSIVLKHGLTEGADGYYEMTLTQSETIDWKEIFSFCGDTMDSATITATKADIDNDIDRFVTVDDEAKTMCFGIVGEWLQVNLEAYNGDVNMDLKVLVDTPSTTTTWNDYSITSYGTSDIDENGGVTLYAGSYSGESPSAMGTADVPYVAFNGEYGYNSHVIVDFTGGNMPNITFAASQPDKNTKNFVGAKGYMFSNGIATKDGTYAGNAARRCNVYGPTLFTRLDGTKPGDYASLLNSAANSTDKGIAYKTMEAATTTQYRLMLSFYECQSGYLLRYSVALLAKNPDYDGTEGTYEYTLVYSSGAVGMKDVYGSTGSPLESGSIIIYGRPYEEIKIDRIHTVSTGNSNTCNTYLKAWTGEKFW